MCWQVSGVLLQRQIIRGDTFYFFFKYGETYPTPNLPGNTEHGLFANHSAYLTYSKCPSDG